MHGVKKRTFNKRVLDKREKLFNPDSPPADWPWLEIDRDHGANWDYLIFIVCVFGIATAIGCALIIGWIGSMVIGWR